ncbi:MAG: TM0996/MTH895 family glutaredoxin-like protein [Methanomassiliicoccales archaeon]|nr:TM0996/MTH895 family glutaredoxin-like protein [Methanomassiliicoccales archaeon]
MRIEVFGIGCVKCKRLEKNVREALAKAGVDAEVVKVDDMTAIMDQGIMVTPALAIDGEVKFMGKVPSVEELIGMIKG